jgi:hypothetical protein
MVLNQYSHLILSVFVLIMYLYRTCVFVYLCIHAGVLIGLALLSLYINKLNY